MSGAANIPGAVPGWETDMCWVYVHKVTSGYCKVGLREHVKGWLGSAPVLLGVWHVEDERAVHLMRTALKPYLVSEPRELFAIDPHRCIPLLRDVLGAPTPVEDGVVHPQLEMRF